ncbi:MAG: hypothetical protein CMM95_01610 [Rickettsiales bacterium]|nr:hypothetical protein [Rickettsiales bacterium]|tara:strand:- start:6011 stop:6424 length:414 start_codon:yes stop_codon:yes gene_type:complete
MSRENMIIMSISFVVIITLMDGLSVLFPKGKELDNLIDIENKLETKKERFRVHNKSESIKSLSIKWGNDIFYDRSNVYDGWFKLTGITKFDNEYKAIVNGEIVHKASKVKGFAVASITKDQVILNRNQYRVTLTLEK